MSRIARPLHMPALAIVIAALTYTAALCFANTNVASIPNALIAVVDGAIVLAALAFAMRPPRRSVMIILLALAVNFLLIAFFTAEFNLKSVRDPLVLIAFVALGQRYGGHRMATTAFMIAAAIVVPLAIIELIAPGFYTQLFDVFRYYQGRGLVSAEQAQYQSSSFFVSGARDDGRFLTAFFGAHRASSVFLEPVSMGNFGALTAAFALSLDSRRWRIAVALGAAAIFCIIAADARFAASVLALFLLARLIPARWVNYALWPLPLIAVVILIAVGATVSETGDTFATRLALSGRMLSELDVDQILGLAPASLSTVDSGYAYALISLGLPTCLLLWVAFMSLPAQTKEAARFKLMFGLYACALLCVSGSSLFALKTAAVGCFALGALAGLRVVARAPERRYTTAPASA